MKKNKLNIEKNLSKFNRNIKYANKTVCPKCKKKYKKSFRTNFICPECDTKVFSKKHPISSKTMFLTRDDIVTYEVLKTKYKNLKRYYRLSSIHNLKLNSQDVKEVRVELLEKLIEKYKVYSIVDEMYVYAQYDIFLVASEIVDKEVAEKYAFRALYYLAFDKQRERRKYREILEYLYNLKKSDKQLEKLFYTYNTTPDRNLFNFIKKDFHDFRREQISINKNDKFNARIQREMNKKVDLNKEYVVLDLETTGLSKDNNKIIEIGAVKIRGGKIVDEFSELVNPQTIINPYIERLTSISNEDVKDKDTEDVVLKRFVKFLEGTDYLVGHNIKGFDYPFLKVACNTHKIKMGAYPCIDTYEIAKDNLGHYIEKFSLSRLCYYFDIDITNAHRAIYDVYATYDLYQNHLKKYLEGHKEVRIEIVESTIRVKNSLKQYLSHKKKFKVKDSFINQDNYSVTRIKNAEEFYELGNLVDVTYGDTTIYFVVKGKTTDYNVEVDFNNSFSDINSIKCSCPAFEKYEGLCKHSISVYMTLKEISDANSTPKKLLLFKQR